MSQLSPGAFTDPFELATQGCAVSLTAFSPLTEVLVAVPMGIGLGLAPVVVVGFAVSGNLAAGGLVHFALGHLQRVSVMRWLIAWLDRDSVRRLADRYAYWLLLLGTPLVGIWSASLAARFVKLDTRRAFAASAVSVLVYSIVVAILTQQGIALVG